MRFRVIDSDNDWTFGKGQNNYATQGNAVQLNVKTRLKEWLNDCFFAQDKGIDYLNRLEKGQEDLLEQDIRTIIIQTDGVARLLDFSFELIDRRFTANYTITTIYDDTFNDFIQSPG